jgi:hypothetical protein
MKTKIIPAGLMVLITALLLSCSTPVSLTSWKNPQATDKVNRLVVMALFGRLDYAKPTEQAVVNYFNSKGLKSIQSLDFLNPTVKYSEDQLQRKVDSVGADGVLIFTYKGTDQKQDYVPTGYYGYYGGPWGYGWWGPPAYSNGYWMTTRFVNLKASLYTSKKANGAIWTADITVTDPNYVDEAATRVAEKIYMDLAKNQLITMGTVTQ